MRFLHTGDCHLGGWRQPEMTSLNLKCFSHIVDTSIKEKLDFVLITGDLFDSAYPSIDIIKEVFAEFKRLNDANIPVFMIAGSHDYSASGKSFLEVLEKSGFAKNVHQPEEKNNFIYLHPVIYKNVAMYGYPGKRTGLEVDEISRIKLHDSPGLFKILMLHTALRDAIGTLPIPAVDQDKLPKVDYTALSHLHVNYNKNNRVYSGPLFPNNVMELEELQGGSFYVVDTSGKIERREVKVKDMEIVDVEITNALTATERILDVLKSKDLKNKIVILRLSGYIEIGKPADIRLGEIELFAKKQGAYSLLRNTSKLHAKESEIRLELSSEKLESSIIEKFEQENPTLFNSLIRPLLSILQTEKKEEENSEKFEDRLMEETNKIMSL